MGKGLKASASQSDGRQFSIAKKNFLIVDDDPLIRRALIRVLEEVGCQVYSAKNGREALDVLQSVTIDLILTDLYMPRMDGLAFIRELHQQGSTIPIILMTGGGTLNIPDSIHIARGFGIDSAISKPFSTAALFQTILKALSKKDLE